VRRSPPAQEVKEIVGVAARRSIGRTADSLLVRVSIDPLHFAAALLDYTKRTVGIVQSVLPSCMESHRRARSGGSARNNETAGIVAVRQFYAPRGVRALGHREPAEKLLLHVFCV
jgi:hypothetical protein